MGFAQPNIEETTTNVLIYGPSGHGKTTGAGTACSDAENPDLAVLNTEGGGWQSIASTLGYVPYVWNISSKKDILQAYTELEAGKHPQIKTVLVDSTTDLAKLLLDDIVENTTRRRDAPGVPSMQDYGELSQVFERMLRRFRDLKMNVIFVALEKDETEEYERNGKTHRRVVGTLPELPGKLAKRLPALVDVCLYAQAIDVPATDEYPTGMRYVWQTKPGKGRICKMRGATLPVIVDQHWSTIAEAFGRVEGLQKPKKKTTKKQNKKADEPVSEAQPAIDEREAVPA